MPRPKRWRKVSNPPKISGFKPYGLNSEDSNAEPIFLRFEEYEAVRLCDYEGMNHHEASLVMGVSRPTLTRIYATARQKIAEALVQGKQINIEGGKIYFDSEWYHCHQCGSYFNHPNKLEPLNECPLCHSTNFERMETMVTEKGVGSMQMDACVCPVCGFSKPHVHGVPCKMEMCPSCHIHLVHQ